MKAIALCSGGKDSVFAIHVAALMGFDVEAVLTIVPRYEAPKLFHKPFAPYVSLQAQSMGMEWLSIEVSSEDEEEHALIRILEMGKKFTEATHLVVGALLSDYQRIRFALAAEKVGLRIVAPLWRKNQVEYMRELVDAGIEAMITYIACYGIPLDWLGRVIDSELVDEIVEKARRYGFNPAFEGGEAETFVVNAPLFRKRVCVDYEKVIVSEFEGFVKPVRVYLC